MFIETAPESAASGDLADYYAQQRGLWGFLPDYAGAFSPAPDVAAAWNALIATVRGRMDRRRFEIVTIAAARALRSTYCTAAHSKFLRDVCGDESSLDAIDADPTGVGLSSPDREIYAFAAKVAAYAASVSQADVDGLLAVGLSDTDVAEVVYAVAARAFFTTVLDGLGAQLDAATAGAFPPELLAGMVVGRPVGSA